MEGKIEQTDKKSGNQTLWWILGCGFALLLGIAGVCGGAAFFGWRLLDQTIPAYLSGKLVEGVEASRLPDGEKRAIVAEVGRVTEAYRDDRIDLEDLGELIETLAEDGIFHVGLIHALRSAVRDHGDLSAEEKLAAETTLTRAERGIWDGTLEIERVEDDLDLRIEKEGNGWEWDDDANWSWDDPEEMRRILAGLEREVEAAGIPMDAAPVDLGGQLARIVDDALGLE